MRDLYIELEKRLATCTSSQVGVLRRSVKDCSDGLGATRQDLRELAEEHALERERQDRLDHRMSDLDKAPLAFFRNRSFAHAG